MSLVPAGELRGAVSPVEPVELTPTVERVLAYERVIEELFQRSTLVPLRYGATFDTPDEVARFLEQHTARCSELLAELDGCVELGLRLLEPLPQFEERPSAPELPAPPIGPGAGRAWLDAQRRRFQAEEAGSTAGQELLDRCAGSLAGVCVKLQIEPAGPASVAFEQRVRSAGDRVRLVGSLHCLVRRERLDEVRRIAGTLRSGGPIRLVLSGPWPPFNFVSLAGQK